jgi:hypothetical protein
MIQFNLLPDVKIEYVKATRTKRLVTGIALIVTATTCAVFLLLAGVVYGVQKKNMSDLSDDISTKSKELRDTPDLDKILTIQNQLGALNGLHDSKVVSTRTFGFIEQFTPEGITISDFLVDYTTNTITISGGSPTLERINVFTDTLKFSKYKLDDDTTTTKAFSNVVLGQFSKGTTEVIYTITLSYDPILFKSGSEVTLIIPPGVTTNSFTGQPSAIFKKPADTQQEGN